MSAQSGDLQSGGEGEGAGAASAPRSCGTPLSSAERRKEKAGGEAGPSQVVDDSWWYFEKYIMYHFDAQDSKCSEGDGHDWVDSVHIQSMSYWAQHLRLCVVM